PVLPDDLHRPQVDAGHIAPGRAHAGQTDRREKRMQYDAIGRAVHRLHADLAAWRMCAVGRRRIVRTTRHELRDEGNVDRVGDCNLPRWVHGDTDPLEHAEIAWKDERS